MNIYCFFDKIGDKVFATFSAPNDGLAIRENVRGIARVMPLGDVDLVHLGEIDDKTMSISLCSPRVVDWESYKFPENPLKPLSPDENQIKPSVAVGSVQSEHVK